MISLLDLIRCSSNSATRNCPCLSACICSMNPSQIALHNLAGYTCAAFALPFSNRMWWCTLCVIVFGHLFVNLRAMQMEFVMKPVGFFAGPVTVPSLDVSPYLHKSPTTLLTASSCSSFCTSLSCHELADCGCSWGKYRPSLIWNLYSFMQTSKVALGTIC